MKSPSRGETGALRTEGGPGVSGECLPQAACCSKRLAVSGSTSAAPPQTSQRYRPLPWHFAQIPMMMPEKDLVGDMAYSNYGSCLRK